MGPTVPGSYAVGAKQNDKVLYAGNALFVRSGVFTQVLSASGVHIDEAKLRELADCTPFGTDAFQLVEAAHKLGFASTVKHTLSSIDELLLLLDEGLYPIVYVDLWPLAGGVSGQYHSFVIIAVGGQSVRVLDPLIGERIIPRVEFEAAWGEMHGLTIVVSA